MSMFNVLSFKRTLFLYHFVFQVPLTSTVLFVKDLSGRKSYTALPDNIRLQIFIFEAIYLRPDIRCCKNHISDNTLKSNAIEKIRCQYSSIASISTFDIMNLIEELTTEAREINFSMKMSPPLSFNNKLLYTDEEYWVLMGICREHFDLLCQQVNMRNTENRSASMAIGCLLVKLRLGLSNTVLATLFCFSDKRTVGHVLESARVALMKNFVQYHLGFEHIIREAVIREHTRPLAKQLLASGKDVAILVMDGTYLYVQKSGNNRLQRKLYNIHKNRPLIKPMMICTTDGFIVSTMGPYLADVHNNDASITNRLLRTNQEGICDWMRSGDVVVVDRGFRDILPLFQSLG